MNGSGNKITLSKKNYKSINKINNGSSNSVVCVDGHSDSNSSIEEEINFPNIKINIGNLQNFGNINFSTNVNGFVNRIIEQPQFQNNEISDFSFGQEYDNSDDNYDSEANYDEVMNEQEKNEIKEKIINNFDKYKYYKYLKKNNYIKQESCSICLEVYKANDNVVEFSCKTHIYHDTCLFEWLQSSDLCPLCKHNLMDEICFYD